MKSLILYYSYRGNTQRIAERIHAAIGGDIARIDTVVPYTGSDDDVVAQGEREVKQGFLPELQAMDLDLSRYDTIVLGTPVWWYTCAPATRAFLTAHDLRGKTVCVPVQNPTFIFQYLCEKNGLTVGTDITIDNTYAQPAELNTALASGEVHIAVLPEPMVTIARAANPALTVALDLTAEWDKVAPAGSLVQGCVVVRKAFADEHPNEVKAFLTEYQASIEYLTAEPDQAGQMIEEAGIFAKAAVAAKAIPNCNVCFVSGADMQAALTEFLTALSTVAPQSIGGKVPGDDFYCILK